MKTRVLIVDDEEEFAYLLGRRLEFRDIFVTIALDGETAVRLVEEQDFEVILLDVLMPGQGGIATLEKIKHLKPLVEVIMLTGHASITTAVEGMELSAYDYLVKPIDIDELLEKIALAAYHKSAEEARLQQIRLSSSRRDRQGLWDLVSGLLNKAFKHEPGRQ